MILGVLNMPPCFSCKNLTPTASAGGTTCTRLLDTYPDQLPISFSSASYWGFTSVRLPDNQSWLWYLDKWTLRSLVSAVYKLLGTPPHTRAIEDTTSRLFQLYTSCYILHLIYLGLTIGKYMWVFFFWYIRELRTLRFANDQRKGIVYWRTKD